jgi:hypothetical protein
MSSGDLDAELAGLGDEETGRGGEGLTVGGLAARQLVARNDFSTLWVVESSGDTGAVKCVRAVPEANLQSPDADQRWQHETEFWKNLRTQAVVELYDCGFDGEHYYHVMPYVQEGSCADSLQREKLGGDRLPLFAVDFAAALASVHELVGAHGNLKPSNVFPGHERGVRVSDFFTPLRADEVEWEDSPLRKTVFHPYRAPEQAEDVSSYDTRSDIYSFGLVLLHCITGSLPPPDGRDPEALHGTVPAMLEDVLARCLEPDAGDRFLDGEALLDALCSATGATPVASSASEPEVAEPVGEDVEGVAGTLDRVRGLMEEGALDEAVGELELLPAGTPGAEELLDEIERRFHTAGQLTQEAVRLAGMGQPDAALETIEQAARLWSKSETIVAVRAEVAAAAGQDEGSVAGRIPKQLRDVLDAQQYTAARPLLENLLRDGPMSAQLRKTVTEFKRGRVRKAFLDNISEARRLFTMGHYREASEKWFEAARWLPHGTDRDRLREIAAAAVSGKLIVDPPDTSAQDMRPDGERAPGEPSQLTPELQARLDEIARETPPAESRTARRILLTIVGLLIGALIYLIWEIFG